MTIGACTSLKLASSTETATAVVVHFVETDRVGGLCPLYLHFVRFTVHLQEPVAERAVEDTVTVIRIPVSPTPVPSG